MMTEEQILQALEGVPRDAIVMTSRPPEIPRPLIVNEIVTKVGDFRLAIGFLYNHNQTVDEDEQFHENISEIWYASAEDRTPEAECDFYIEQALVPGLVTHILLIAGGEQK